MFHANLGVGGPATSDFRNAFRVAAVMWESTAAGAHLRGRRVRDTVPEVSLRRAVHRLGLRFRLHRQVVKGCVPDFVLPRWRLAVFVDGCFWHGCPVHGPRTFRGPNADRWREKIATNRARDERVSAMVERSGWRVLRVWECEIRRDVAVAAGRVFEQACFGLAADQSG